MKILSVRKGFQADHSSTSYEFFAVDKPLRPAARKAVAKLSSRARPTKRRVSFIYHGDFNNLPGGWEPLMRRYYDVMYSESYGWWTLSMAFKTNQKAVEKIRRYDFTGSDDLGVTVDSEGKRIIVSIFCCLSAEVMDCSYDDYEEEDSDEDEESNTIESNDNLLDLLVQNREYLKKGDLRLLYGVWKKYGSDSEEGEDLKQDSPPEPSGMDKLPKATEYLLSLLEKI